MRPLQLYKCNAVVSQADTLAADGLQTDSLTTLQTKTAVPLAMMANG